MYEFAHPHLAPRLAVRNFTPAAAEAVRPPIGVKLRGGASLAAVVHVVLMAAFNAQTVVPRLDLFDVLCN